MADNASQNRYAAQGEIARGGMGVILRVRDRNLDRTLAMKRMLAAPEPDGSDRQEMQFARFLEEAQITAQLDHPSIVPVHELGSDEEGRIYYTMRLIKGREFGEVIREVQAQSADGPLTPALSPSEGAREERNPLRSNLAGTSSSTPGSRWNLQRALGVMVRVCQAVAYAHARGVIHRDLKPANIMVGDLGEVYVMDWGLARMHGREDVHDIRLRLDDPGAEEMETPAVSKRGIGPQGAGASLMTMDGAVIGTPAYMPPEQAAGRVSEVDQGSDIYSLGAVLYELLTGQPPYMPADRKTTPQQVLTGLLSEPPERIRRINAAAPPELAAICEKAMARSKSERYGSCIDLAEDLQAYLDQRVVKAYQTGPVVEFRKWVQRNRATAIAGTVALVAVVAGLTVTTLIERRSAEKQKRAFRSEQSARQAAMITLADSYTALGLQEAGNGQFAGAQLWFAEAARTAAEDPARAHANWIRAQVHARHVAVPIRAFRAPSGNLEASEFVAGGRWLQVWSTAAQAWKLLDLESESVLHTGPDPMGALAWHPDGKRVAVQRAGNRVEIRRIPGLEIEATIAAPGAGSRLDFSPDGRWLFIGGAGARLWDARAGRMIEAVLPHEEDVFSAAFSPDGNHLLTATRANVRLFRIGMDGAVETILRPMPKQRIPAGIGVQFVGEGRQFVIPANWDTFEAWDTATAKLVSRWRMLPNRPLAEARLLEDVANGGGAAFGVDGRVDPTRLSVVRHARDGTFLHQPSQWALIHMDSRTGSSLGSVGHFVHQIGTSQISPDGTMAASSEVGEGNLIVWRLPDPPALSVVARDVRTLAGFSPDSRHFVPSGYGQLFADAAFAPRQTRVHETASARPAGPWLEAQAGIVAAAFAAGDKALALGCNPQERRTAATLLLPDGRSGNVQLWDWRSGARLLDPIAVPSEPRLLRAHPKGDELAVLCVGGELFRLEVPSGRITPINHLPAAHLGRSVGGADPGDLRFTDDGRTLVAWNMNPSVQILDWPSGRIRFPAITNRFPVESIAVHNRVLAVVSEARTAPESITFWNLDLGKPEPGGIDFPIRGRPLCGRFSEDGERFLLSGLLGAVRLWNWHSGEATCPDMPHDTWVRAEFIPGTPWLVSAGDDHGRGQIKLWDAGSGRPIAPEVPAPAGYVMGLCVSPDGRTALVSDTTEPATLSHIDLSPLHKLEHPELGVADRMQLARLNSGGRPHQGGIVKLTSKEWFDEWTDFRRRHPGLHRFTLPVAKRVRWHEHHAARLETLDAVAAEWHRVRARELEQFQD